MHYFASAGAGPSSAGAGPSSAMDTSGAGPSSAGAGPSSLGQLELPSTLGPSLGSGIGSFEHGASGASSDDAMDG